MEHKKIFSLLLVALSLTSLATSYDYHVEIELKDGTEHVYEGSTRDGRMQNHFGHDPSDIVKEDVQVTPWD